MGLHSTEVGAAQMAAELMYDMVTRTDSEMMRILDNVVAIMVPSFNPDGTAMVTDWYNETVRTDYEGVGCRGCNHKYIGHDNNRDAFQQNTVESQYGAQIIFRDWIPQAYVDHHQMGAYGARIYVPPVCRADPTRGRPARLARDELVRRPHRLQGGRGQQVGCRERGHLLRLGTFRLPLDYTVPQHRGHAHRVGKRTAGHSAVPPSRPADRLPPRPSGVRSADLVPEPLAGWLVARLDIVEQQKKRWDGQKPDGTFQSASMNSFNHYAYGAVGDWMYRVVAGIDTSESEPGYKHVLIGPQPGGGLTQAHATLDTMYGAVESEWNRSGDRFELRVVVPPNTTATVRIPDARLDRVTEGGRPVQSTDGVTGAAQDGDATVLDVGSGSYLFAVARN